MGFQDDRDTASPSLGAGGVNMIRIIVQLVIQLD